MNYKLPISWFKFSELYKGVRGASLDRVLNDLTITNNVIQLCVYLSELRQLFGSAIVVNSGVRTPEHNLSIGGSPTSQHLFGSAADITVTFRGSATVEQLLYLIRDHEQLTKPMYRVLGQVIYYPERKFIHVALKSAKYPHYTEFSCINGELHKVHEIPN